MDSAVVNPPFLQEFEFNVAREFLEGIHNASVAKSATLKLVGPKDQLDFCKFWVFLTKEGDLPPQMLLQKKLGNELFHQIRRHGMAADGDVLLVNSAQNPESPDYFLVTNSPQQNVPLWLDALLEKILAFQPANIGFVCCDEQGLSSMEGLLKHLILARENPWYYFFLPDGELTPTVGKFLEIKKT